MAPARVDAYVAARDLFAEQFCLPSVEIEVDPAFPSTAQPGVASALRVVARRSDLTDDTVSQQPGVRLELNVVGGTVGSVTGTTGADGAFNTTATPGRSRHPARDRDHRARRGGRAGARSPDRRGYAGGAGIDHDRHPELRLPRAGRGLRRQGRAGLRDPDRPAGGRAHHLRPVLGGAGASANQQGTPGFYEGNAASATANVNQSSNIQPVSDAPEVTANGTASGSSQRTFGANPSAHSAHSSQASVSLRFMVTGGSVPWSAQGTLSASPTHTFDVDA